MSKYVKAGLAVALAAPLLTVFVNTSASALDYPAENDCVKPFGAVTTTPSGPNGAYGIDNGPEEGCAGGSGGFGARADGGRYILDVVFAGLENDGNPATNLTAVRSQNCQGTNPGNTDSIDADATLAFLGSTVGIVFNTDGNGRPIGISRTVTEGTADLPAQLVCIDDRLPGSP